MKNWQIIFKNIAYDSYKSKEHVETREYPISTQWKNKMLLLTFLKNRTFLLESKGWTIEKISIIDITTTLSRVLIPFKH